MVQGDVGAAEEPKGIQGCLGAWGFRGRSEDPRVAQGPPPSLTLLGNASQEAVQPWLQVRGHKGPGQARQELPVGTNRGARGLEGKWGAGSSQDTWLTSHSVGPGERSRAVRRPNVQV